MMIGPDGVPIPIPVDDTKLEMDAYFEAGYEDEYQEEYIPYQVPLSPRSSLKCQELLTKFAKFD